MMIPSVASKIYQTAAQQSVKSPFADSSVSFSDTLMQTIQDGWSATKTQLQQADAGMTAAASGQSVDPTKLVHDVSQAGLMLEIATTLRDKIIQAYRDIAHMPL